MGAKGLIMSGPRLVRAEGLEPPRLSSREPKSRASTSSATPAKGITGPSEPGRAARLISCINDAAHGKNWPEFGGPDEGEGLGGAPHRSRPPLRMALQNGGSRSGARRMVAAPGYPGCARVIMLRPETITRE